MPPADAPLIERDPAILKRRFKQRCAATNNVYQNWLIRVHRSLSWSIRAATLAQQHPEAELLYLWIALNSLYARWNNERNVPDQDHPSRGDFLRAFTSVETDRVIEFLRVSKPILRKLLGSPYLSNVFWRDPTSARAADLARQDVYNLDRLLRDRRADKLLNAALDRVFVFRGQLVHGASSGGSRLNRSSLESCLEFMRGVVPLLQHLVIEHGAHDDWPDLCYPPVEQR